MSSEPLRVLLIIDSLGAGGAERSMIDLVPALAEHGIVVEVSTLKDRTEGVADLQLSEVTHHNVGTSSVLTTIGGLRGMMRRIGPDVIHTTLFQADILGRIAAIGTRVPVVSSLVNMGYQPIRLEDPNVRRIRLTAARMLDGLTARHLTTWFHALTRAAADDAVRALRISPHVITVIPRGRRPERWDREGDRSSELRSEFGIEADRPVVLAVGRHEFQKDHVTFVRAIEIVSTRLPAVISLIAGREGNATAQICEAMAEVDADIRLLGHRTDVPELMKMADVLAFPSVYEGFGGVVVEAMASGLPVVCSDLEPLKEVAGPAAKFTPVRDPAALAECILEVLTKPGMAEALSNEGRKRFRSLYTLDSVAERMAALYRAVANIR